MDDFREDPSSIIIIVDGPFLTLYAGFYDLDRMDSQLSEEHRPSSSVGAWESDRLSGSMFPATISQRIISNGKLVLTSQIAPQLLLMVIIHG